MGGKDSQTCLLCGGTSFTTKFADRGIHLPEAFLQSCEVENLFAIADCEVVSCDGCGLAFRRSPVIGIHNTSPWPASMLSIENGSNPEPLMYSIPVSAASPQVGVEEIEEICRFLSPPGRFLNVGSDCSDIMEAAKLFGWTSESVQDIRESSGSDREGFIPAMSLRQRYNVVRMEGSLERALDPEALLRQAGQFLSRNGLLVITTPDCSDWDFTLYGQGESLWPLDLPLWFFTPDTLKRLLMRLGYKVLGLSRHDVICDLFPTLLSTSIPDRIANDGQTIEGCLRASSQRIKVFRIIARQERKTVYQALKRENREFIPKEETAIREPS